MRTKIFILILLIFGFAYAQYTDYDAIRFRKNPSIKLPSGDTISNRTPGIIDMSGSAIKAKNIISDTNTIPTGYWEVSPSYPLDLWRKTSPSISEALTYIDSGVIQVHPGIYRELITAKNKVSIVGDDQNRVIISAVDTAIVYIFNCNNFTLKNLTILSNSTGSNNSTLIRIRNSWSDTLQFTNITLDNLILKLTGEDDVRGYNIYSDSASYILTNTLLYTSNPAGSFGEWFNIRNDKSTNAYIENCRFINMLTASTNNIVFSDTRGKLFMIGCKIYNQTPHQIFNSTQSVMRLINNISNDTLNVSVGLGPGTDMLLYINNFKSDLFYIRP